MQAVLLVTGGALGTYLRYVISGLVQPAGDGAFPFGTLAVNVSGALIAGVATTLLLERTALPTELRTALFVGVLGGYTTFSAFSVETLALANAGQWGYAALNIAVSVSGALLAVWAGQTVARL